MVDILVLGATGYTGKLITRYLHAHRERETFSFGVAGRSKARLAELVAELGLSKNVPVFQIDVMNTETLEDVVCQAKVVINTVAPFYRMAIPIVRACALNGVHYVDITGELHFVRALVEKYDFLATKTHTIIVPSCAYDSLPADALVFLSSRTMHAATHGQVGIAQSHTMYAARSGISGGTIASTLAMIEDVPDASWEVLRNPYVLSPLNVPKVEQAGSKGKLVYTLPGVRRNAYGHINPIALHNIAIVQRTRGLLMLRARALANSAPPLLSQEERNEKEEPPYGDTLEYTESLKAGGFISAYLIGLVLVIGGTCLSLFPSVRWLLRRLVPQSGQGPSDKELEKGFLKACNISVSAPLPDSKKPVVVETTIRGRGDPGYTLTAIMISESALCLLTPSRLPALALNGGVLTPMSAFGDSIIRRLAASGRFEFESEVLGDA